MLTSLLEGGATRSRRDERMLTSLWERTEVVEPQVESPGGDQAYPTKLAQP